MKSFYTNMILSGLKEKNNLFHKTDVPFFYLHEVIKIYNLHIFTLFDFLT